MNLIRLAIFGGALFALVHSEWSVSTAIVAAYIVGGVHIHAVHRKWFEL